MGFLYQVLKDVSEKQPYKVGRDILIKLIDEQIKPKLSTGREGFKVIEQVAEKVGEYNGLVEQSNETVKNKITNLDEQMEQVKKDVNETYPTKNDNDEEPNADKIEKSKNEVTQTVKKCQQLASTFRREILNFKDKIKDLGHEANEQINKARDNVEREGQRLGRVQKNEENEFKEMEKRIREKLEELGGSVKKQISCNVTELVDKLKKAVQNIKTDIVRISKLLTSYVLELEGWMKEAKRFIDGVMQNQVKAVRDEVAWDESGKSEKRWNQIENAATELRKKAQKLFEAGEEAKKSVQETVRLALQQVMTMNDALKTDLFTVKGKIKAAVMALGKTLETYVKDGLWKIEDPINKQVDEIVRSSSDFLTKFEATKGALEKALEIVAGDLQTIWSLTEFEKIKGTYNRTVQAPLLEAIGTRDIFSDLKTYFNNVNAQLVQNVRDALEGMGKNWQSAFKYTIEAESIQAIRKLVTHSSAPPTLDTAALQKYGIDISKNVRKLDLTNNVTNMKKVIDNLEKYHTLDKVDLENIFKELAQITQTVSSHSKTVVEEVIKAMQRNVKLEVETVADFVKDKIVNMRNGVEFNQHDREFDYGGGGAKANVRSFPILVTQYQDIDRKLLQLKNDVIPQAFKKNPPGSKDPMTYTFGEQLMKDFKKTYDDNFTHGDIKTGGGAGRTSVLDEEVGGQIMTGTGNDNKIANFAEKNFSEYIKIVTQDSVSAAVGDPTQLDGALPIKIKEIQEQVATVALASIDQLNEQAETQFREVTSTLSQLCGAVQRSLKDVNFFLNNFKEGQIGEKLEAIKEKINKLQSIDLKNLIKSTEAFAGFSTEQCAKAIEELDKHVNSQVETATEKLTTQAKKHYVSTLKTELQNFTARVQGHLTGLTTIIDKDLVQGYKGLMKTVQGVKFIVEHRKDAEFDTSADTALFTKLKDAVPVPPGQEKLTKEHFEALSSAFKHYFNNIHGYVKEEISRLDKQYKQTLNYQLTHTESKYLERLYTSKLDAANTALNNLLDHISNHRYDHEVPALLDSLSTKVDGLHPKTFNEPSSPLLDGISKGLGKFAAELSKTYLNAYDGASDGMVLVDARTTKVTDDGKRCAKVCLSLLSILYSEFKTILKYCVARCKSDQININTDLGKYFATQGYKVTEDGKKHWELQDSKGMTGLFICKRMFGSDEHHLYYIDKSKQNALDTLHDCLQIYYQVCHVATFSARKRPCNIFEMLCWVSGLPCNNVFDEMLHETVSELFVDPSKQPEDADGIPVTYISDEPLAAYPLSIAYDDTRRAVKRLCSRSHDILTTIAGTGDAYSMYAVDYSTNSLNFHYPSKGEDCLQMLLDVLRRLLPSLKFLHTQCGLSSAYHGWSGCQYGRGVKHSNWQCGEHPADESTDCLPRSPLMSYLRDCLPGCLPHQLVSAGCKSECKTCPKSLPGAPCITPLGFRGFSGSTKTGKDICNVLTKFFDNSNINTLFGLLPKPPSTLPEHFQFALTLSSMLDHGKSASDDVSLAFETKTKALSIELYKETSKLTGALQNAYRNQTGHNSSGHSKSTEADLWSLSRESCNLPHDRDIHCAPYLCSTSSDAYKYLAKKHADLYLSWAVYLPWTFYSYLKSLLDAFQQIDCGGSGCTKCSCKPGKHGVEYNCKCNALISCRGVMTTFYQYGFTFGNAKTLYGTNRKFCHSFHTQLSNLLKSQYFTKLFEECDNFIWTIREPFTYLILALWSLSLFYLMCVMVGRLDVLHIRSHLRIPSSHRITAQSLLAAAQVGRLAKISYLQP
ncbi:hypothetical protein, conserved [Babesia bigemina]|uniref:C3H1-type domain-containing protein n=1 Tax=Babesia bigemina TaxID=5866 RepID=A0A061BJ23_BABBI|nr:hypothetical protein, conserved [Babesia bigemina]CDR71499.1 hypothetical protein, conserved [Babesia bigemina]|eukprot:XP_012770445.1 hypothetical protein, conserved [Babesia bigemina]